MSLNVSAVLTVLCAGVAWAEEPAITAESAPPPRFELAVGTSVDAFDAFIRSVSVEAAASWRFSDRFTWRGARLHYVFLPMTGFATLLASDFGIASAGAGNHARVRAGTDVVFTLYRSEQTASGFRFEASVAAGPTLFLLERPPAVPGRAATELPSFAGGGSAELALDVRLPQLPELHLKAGGACDVFYAGGSIGPPVSVSGRLTLGVGWRFGGAD